ncbi:MAG TPA: hypothetical protein VLG48_11130 [Candidatus Methylomirabilis sp.]|nr:hypothetical protein [Candidatus Methylomirabilis sp.]
MTLAFEVLSGATISIDTTACPTCESKACARVCAAQSPGPVLVIGDDGRPRLKPTLAEVKRGVCTECLGCLLDCEVRGKNVVRFQVPLPGLEAFIAGEEAAGRVPVYRRAQ